MYGRIEDYLAYSTRILWIDQQSYSPQSDLTSAASTVVPLSCLMQKRKARDPVGGVGPIFKLNLLPKVQHRNRALPALNWSLHLCDPPNARFASFHTNGGNEWLFNVTASSPEGPEWAPRSLRCHAAATVIAQITGGRVTGGRRMRTRSVARPSPALI